MFFFNGMRSFDARVRILTTYEWQVSKLAQLKRVMFTHLLSSITLFIDSEEHEGCSMSWLELT